MPPTAAGGERCFSAFSNVWTDKRANLMVGRVGMLVYIYFNSRVLANQARSDGINWEEFVQYLESLPPLEMLMGGDDVTEVLPTDGNAAAVAGTSQGQSLETGSIAGSANV